MGRLGAIGATCCTISSLCPARDLWPKFVAFYDVPLGGVQAPLVQFMADKALGCGRFCCRDDAAWPWPTSSAAMGT